MKVLDQIEDMLCDELESVVKKKELTTSSLELIDTAVDIVKDIHTVRAMDEEFGSHPGYSQGYYGRMPYYMYDDMPSGSSYARGRGSSGQMSSRGRYYNDGYSGDTKDELQRLMSTAKNDHEREAIRTAIDNMNR